MAKYSIGAAEFQQQRQSFFDEFVSLVKGRSIISVADWGEDRMELGLTGGVMIRFFTGREEPEITPLRLCRRY